jgi:pimeloyl-ACP methyl ester carboxylesterase
MKFLELHGDRVAYREAGAGEALLLIHGMAGSSATWRAVLPQLSKKYRVVAPDLFGHGESAKPRGAYSLGAFAVSLRDLLDELGITRATEWVSRSVAVWPCNSSISIATIASGWF